MCYENNYSRGKPERYAGNGHGRHAGKGSKSDMSGMNMEVTQVKTSKFVEGDVVDTPGALISSYRCPVCVR